MFNERLVQYRNDHYLKMKEMAEKLEVSESYYSLIESGKRTPSKTVLDKIVSVSNLPEEYWLYGIKKTDYYKSENEFKHLKKTLKTIIEFKAIKSSSEIFDKENNPKDSLGKLLISALKSDVDYMLNGTEE